MTSNVNGRDLQRSDWRQAELDGLANAMIDMTFVHQIAEMIVIRFADHFHIDPSTSGGASCVLFISAIPVYGQFLN